jgi:flagellar biosynthesis chaperone FliJ
MDISNQTVQRIQKFAEKRQEVEHESAKEPLSGTALQAYSRRLDATLQELQNQVKRQQNELNKVRHKTLDIAVL